MAIKDIDHSLETIGSYLQLTGSEYFAIPPYQRAYSWNIDQCDRLWQDIEKVIEVGDNDKTHFLGTIIIDCSGQSELNLIDGQQRTTTFLLLLKVLQLKISEALKTMRKDEDSEYLEEGLKNSYNAIIDLLYKADDEKRIAIKRDWDKARGVEIVVNKSINELYKEDLGKILDAKSFDEAFQTATIIKYKRKDNKYTNFFRNFKFFYLKMEEHKGESWLNIFSKTLLRKCQIIVIKSWQLDQAIEMFNSLNSTGMPLSDADIISAQLYSSSSDKQKFIDRWKLIIKQANNLSLAKVVDIDGVLQEAMYILRTSNREYKENEVTTPGVRRYYMEDQRKRLEKPDELCSLFEKIINIWNKIKDYSSIKLLLKFNENSKLFLVTYLSRYSVDEIAEKDILPVVECLLRLFVVNELVDSGYSSSKFKTFLFNENFKLADKKVSEIEIENDFRNHINNTWQKDELGESIFDYAKNALVYLNEYLYAKSTGDSFVIDDNVNIEHVMPSSGHNLDQIRIDAGMLDKEEFDEYANRLGNKILLEENINKSIGNDWFRTKKGSSVSDKRGYLGSKFRLAKALAAYPKDLWQKDDIDKATSLAADRILEFVFK